MAVEDDLRIIAEQEKQLAFEVFDEEVAFVLGTRIREIGKGFGRGVAVGVYLWDRTMFYGVTAGAVSHNRAWVERKAKTVGMYLKSSYRVVLERGDKGRVLEPQWATETTEYALAGGGFPIVLKGFGPIGAAAASGLSERDDHEIVRAAVAELTGHEASFLALPKA